MRYTKNYYIARIGKKMKQIANEHSLDDREIFILTTYLNNERDQNDLKTILRVIRSTTFKFLVRSKRDSTLLQFEVIN